MPSSTPHSFDPQRAFLAVDWGTTNLRAWVVSEGGAAGPPLELPRGVAKLGPGEPAVCLHDVVRPALKAEHLPAVICGMAGSTLGWVEVPYSDCPADAASLAAGLHWIEDQDPPVAIVPGLRGPGVDGGPDVMRGEETQVIGWLVQDPARSRGRHILCHPGTHAKWVLVEDGRVVRFVTAMTGELFSVLTRHSVLRCEDGPEDATAFAQGLIAAGDGSALAARLFTARARVVGGGDLKPEGVRSFLSGLLIGAEAASTPALLNAGPTSSIALIGDAKLCAAYGAAMAHLGLQSQAFDGETAVLAGLKAIIGKASHDDP
jgi:2-dehydro-3-deoxygalactonokinase